jgi:hypothetical protein
MMPALESAIGPGPFQVLLEDWAACYSARNLGWKIYHPGLLFPGPAFPDFLQTMDNIIVLEQPLYKTAKLLVEDNPNFELHARNQIKKNESKSFEWGPIRIPVVGRSYPTILVFRKLN